MAIQRQVQPARVTAVQGQQLALGQGQGGSTRRARAEQMLAYPSAHQGALSKKQLRLRRVSSSLELVGEGGLGEVEGERRPGQDPCSARALVFRCLRSMPGLP